MRGAMPPLLDPFEVSCLIDLCCGVVYVADPRTFCVPICSAGERTIVGSCIYLAVSNFFVCVFCSALCASLFFTIHFPAKLCKQVIHSRP